MKKALLILSIFFSQNTFAKDLTNRLGIGYADTFSIDLPSIALHYYPSYKTSIALHLGVNTEEDNSKFGFAFKAFRLIFEEENLNFHMGGSAAIISNEVNGKSDSGFEVNALIATEFFFTGLDSLAFLFETGIGIVSLDDGVTFRTIADSPIRAGIIFYF